MHWILAPRRAIRRADDAASALFVPLAAVVTTAPDCEGSDYK